MYVWKVIIRYRGTKKVIRIKGGPEHDNLTVYHKAKAYAKKLKEASQDEGMLIDLVSGSRAYAPKHGTKIPRGHYWCPYCLKPRIFYNDSEIGVKKCSVCGISDSDFYVKKYNGIFEDEYRDFFIKSKIPRKEVT